MDPETPAPPPEARLIRAAREAAGISAAKAAEATNGVVSPVYWRDVERGRGGRRGKQVRVRGSAKVIAHMARVVGVAPDRLESEGQHPEAAEILREILRSQDQPSPERSRPQLAEVPHPGMEPALLARLLRRLVDASGPREGDTGHRREVLERRREVLDLILESRRDLPDKAEMILDVLRDDPSLPIDWDKPADGDARHA